MSGPSVAVERKKAQTRSATVEDIITGRLGEEGQLGRRPARKERKGRDVARAGDHVGLNDLALAGFCSFKESEDDAKRTDEAAAGKASDEVDWRIGHVLMRRLEHVQHARQRNVINVCGRLISLFTTRSLSQR